jgi:hypothetical protein
LEKNENDVTDILEGWAACNHRYMAYKTHSKKDCDGKRKNYGLNGLHDHLKQCKSKPKMNLNINQGQTNQTTIPTIQPKFAFYKKTLPERYQVKLKDAELKYIVTGSH